jgi:hypothetical protein
MPADFVKKSTNDALVYAENKNKKGNGFIVRGGLTNDTPTVTDLDDYVREGLKQFTPDTTFLEKKKFEIGSYEALRLKLQMIIANVPVGEGVYFIKDATSGFLLASLIMMNFAIDCRSSIKLPTPFASTLNKKLPQIVPAGVALIYLQV